jgi:hypothetical protein
MHDVIDPADERKPAFSPSDAAALIRARRARSPRHLERLVAFHRARGVPDREIARAMVSCPALVDALGRGRPR